jgi:hypothetical protein
MAKVRITAYCQGCESYIDTTVHANRALRMLQGFQAAHDSECYEEDPDGEKEAGADPGATAVVADPGATDAQAGAATTGSGARAAKDPVH